MTDLCFPPLFTGHAVPSGTAPFEAAKAEAVRGCDAGLVTYDLGADSLRAAIVFAPEVPLAEAMAMLPLCGVGFQNALGALAPPEVAVHLDWDGGIRLNGAVCGGFAVASSDIDPNHIPDWLVVGLSLTLWPRSDDPGETPDETALYAEGCGDVDPAQLLEAWVRHTLAQINIWSDDGVAPLHKEWSGIAHGIGDPISVAGQTGDFIGVDERFGMLLRDANNTHLIPLTQLLEPA